MKQLLIFFCLVVLAFAVDTKFLDQSDLNDDPIVINVSGEVKHPGPVTASPYTTLREILNEAEPTEDADLDTLNPDMVLNDHDVLIVPKKKEESEAQRISINTSGIEELESLPGIGPSIAQRILDYRAEYGFFQNTEDIMNVPGIGPAKYEKISDRICL